MPCQVSNTKAIRTKQDLARDRNRREMAPPRQSASHAKDTGRPIVARNGSDKSWCRSCEDSAL